MRKLLTTTALTAGLFAASLAGAGSASAATVVPPVLPATDIAISAIDAKALIDNLIGGGCTTQFVNREIYGPGPTNLVSVDLYTLDITIHGGNAVNYTFYHAGSAITYVFCIL